MNVLSSYYRINKNEKESKNKQKSFILKNRYERSILKNEFQSLKRSNIQK